MRLHSQHGQLTIVQHRFEPDKLVIQSRKQKELESFASLLHELGEPAEVEKVTFSGFRYRIVADRRMAAAAVARLTYQIDYPHFKEKVHSAPCRNMAYVEVVNALGMARQAYDALPTPH